MAKKPFDLFREGPRLTLVYIKGSIEPCAHLYLQTDNANYRFRLVNYPHRMSKLFSSEKSALAAIEKEVL